MKAYINGIGAVSPQNTLSEDHFLDDVQAVETHLLQVLKPDYKQFVSPKVLRRMSKIVRMSVAAAKTAMTEAGIEQPDAILTGTGMGCQADTEKFLNSVIDNNEELLNPTAFIQSTHNTMGAQIALMLQNHNYNLTYVNRGFSFESALLDSLLLLAENKAKNVLLGGIDEITEESWLISTKTGVYKKEPLNNLKLLDDKQEGALAGEGASFFMISNEKTDTSCARITAPETFYKPENISVIKEKITGFLNARELAPENIDLILYGYSGDKKAGHIYEQMEHDLFLQNAGAYFKHLSGEYDTAVAFAVWLGTKILKTGTVPEVIRRKNNSGSAVRNILIYNISHNMYHSLILLEEV
jgi:3-oxoacyl-(acyl-carrier-protein) synthase